jgi:RNA polymerase sigma-70 factor (ECF subfamily)
MELSNNMEIGELVRKAQNGCQLSMESLIRQAEGGLYTYIFRLTLNHSLAEDIKQETLLEVVKSIKRIEQPERFRAWLYRTALGKVQHYFRDKQKEKDFQPMSSFEKDNLLERAAKSDGGLKNLINKELSEAIIDAMSKLKLSHRNILILRCYDNLPYSKIAEIMDCNELAAQVLFFRAKAALKKKLSKNGFSKGMMLGALGLFGYMTGTEATAATVSASSIKVGTTAAIIATVFSKIGLMIFGILASISITTLKISSLDENQNAVAGLPTRSEIKSYHYVRQAWDKGSKANSNLIRGKSLSKGAYEQWHYFPEGIDGPMFMMMQRWDPQQHSKLCGWLQNASGNYYYHSGSRTIYLYDSRLFMLQTRRLPSDTEEFTKFLDEVEGQSDGVDYTRDPESGLLTGLLDTRFSNAQNFKSPIIYNRCDEKSFGSFRYTWPDANVIDQRDEMRKRGWTYFKVSGNVGGEKVTGCGRIPFIYDTYKVQKPWLKMTVGSKLEIADRGDEAYAKSGENIAMASVGGSFFKGLAQPWMGLHTIDVIRRDAAEKRIRFQFAISNTFDGHQFGEIKLFDKSDPCAVMAICRVNIDEDLLEKIEFQANIEKGYKAGVLEFKYLQKIENAGDEFVEPEKIKAKKLQENTGILWLEELQKGTLGQ